MKERMKRAARLVDLAEKAMSTARVRLAAAQRAAAEAGADAERYEAVWDAATEGFGRGIANASDLERQAAHLRTLRVHADLAARRLEAALAESRRCSEALSEAMSEKRKLELWQERLAEIEREQLVLADRRASDELAARTLRGRP
jgi:flagellar biosynthesis chaperone FliJ